MKITFNLGAVKFNLAKPETERIVHSITVRDGVALATPEVLESKFSPAVNVEFFLEASSYSFECEVGELADLYKVMGSIVSDLTKKIGSIVIQLNDNKEVSRKADREYEDRKKAGKA